MNGIYESTRDNHNEPYCWCMKNDKCPPHFHSSIELTYVISGSIACTVNGKLYVLGEHEFLFSPSYHLHQYETVIEGSTSINFTAPLNSIPSFAKIMESSRFKTTHGKLPADNEILSNLKILAKLEQEKSRNKIKIKGHIYSMLGELIEILGLESFQKNAHSDFTRDVLVFIDEHYLDDINSETVAHEFGYSKSHFLHIFTSNFGFCFSEYINILKCRHAAMLIINGQQELIDIALSSGFNNMRSFYRNFKNVFLMTPTEYLQNYKLHLYNKE